MASTVVVVVCMSGVVGISVQSIAFTNAIQSHNENIRLMMEQIASENRKAFELPYDMDGVSNTLKNAVKFPGVVFAAAFTVQGDLISYSRGLGYRGNLSKHLLGYGKSGDATVFTPQDDGRPFTFEAQPIYGTQQVERASTRVRLGSLLVAHTTVLVEEKFGVVRREIWSLIAVVGVSAAVLAWLASHTLVRPIYTLIQGTQRIARGEYSCVIIRSHDELHLLADSFNSMSEQLRQSREKLDATNRNLEETVRLRTKRLQEALQELQVLDKMKDEFLSSISHEFRTPLTSIKAFAEILLEERDPDTVSEFLGIILRESNRLEGLVNDVLDLVKMESGEMPFRFSETSPGAILRNSVQAARERAVEHHIHVAAQEEEMELLAMWDGAKITRLLLELLNNAIRFSPPGSQIQVTLSRRAGGVRYAVRDQGPGLPPGDLERVFEKFRQIGEALTGKPMGAGLGLPICRLIAENHGGTIHAETPEGGGGALFVLDLPLDARVVSPVAHRRKAPPRAEVANEVPEDLYEARESLV